MIQYIDKSALVAEINRVLNSYDPNEITSGRYALVDLRNFIETLEVKDPYEQWIQYSSIEAGIKAHAEEYSFNIESELFNQLTKEQQALWRKEIEEAVISGGYNGLTLAKDPRYEENHEVKEVDLDYIKDELDRVVKIYKPDGDFGWGTLYNIATHFFELGLKKRTKNIWHSMDETPNYPCDILFVTNVDNMFLFRYMENGRPVDGETSYFRNILNGKCWCYCNDIINNL